MVYGIGAEYVARVELERFRTAETIEAFRVKRDTPELNDFQPSVESVSVLRKHWQKPKQVFPKWMIELARGIDDGS